MRKRAREPDSEELSEGCLVSSLEESELREHQEDRRPSKLKAPPKGATSGD